MTARSNAARMIASGKRNADRLHAELYVVYVEQAELTDSDRVTLARNLSLASEAGARVEVLPRGDPIAAILNFARERGITQIFIGHTQRRGWWTRLLGGPVDRLIRRAEGMDVQVFPH
ncbi:MAG: universal stress protein [Acidobacteria bacterium]|nr:universal stress protein [Acidobacteriota bacterium]